MSDHSTSQTETADGRCFWEPSNKTYTPIFHDGQINIAAHHVGWLIAGFFTIVAVAVSFWLIDKHFVWYTNKAQQRQIVRLLLMVPIYAVVSMASFVYWNHAVAIVLARDCYESFVLYSFFYLLLLYISNDPMEQRLVFQKVKIDKWMFPLGFVKWRPEDGLYFLQLMKWGVLQYCIFRPGCTLFALILEYMGYYCEESWSPRYGHVWILVIISLSVTVAMYCLLQLYFAVADELKPYNPILKLFAIKAVVFLTFWQASFLSVLASFGFIKDTEYMSAVDINVAIGALLETFEMMLFAFLHIKAFTYRIYQADDRDPKKRTSRWRAFRHAFWYRDMFKEFKDGIIYLWRRMRGKEAEKVMRKQIHLENAMGRSRRMHRGRGGGVERPEPKEGMPAERPDLPFLQLDPPGVGLSGAIGQELEKRGFRSSKRRDSEDDDQELLDARAHGHGKQQSWWRRAMHRVSGRASGDDQYAELASPTEKVRSPRRGQHARAAVDNVQDLDFDPLDEPPPSLTMRNGRDHSQSPRGPKYARVAGTDDEDLELGRRARRGHGREAKRGSHERGDRPGYKPQRSQPINFAVLNHHEAAQQEERAQANASSGSRSPQPVGRLTELSRSPPRPAVPLKPPSVARTDSMLGRMFSRPVEDSALSHGHDSTAGDLTRNVSLVSDPRMHAVRNAAAPNIAAFALATPVLSVAPDLQETTEDEEPNRSAQPAVHARETTVPPPPPSKDVPHRDDSPASSVRSFATAAETRSQPPSPLSPTTNNRWETQDALPQPPPDREHESVPELLLPPQQQSPPRAQRPNRRVEERGWQPEALPQHQQHPLAQPTLQPSPPRHERRREGLQLMSPQEIGPPSAVRRPAKIVMPDPLSPARFPGLNGQSPGTSGQPTQYPSSSGLDPRRDDFMLPRPGQQEHRRREEPRRQLMDSHRTRREPQPEMHRRQQEVVVSPQRFNQPYSPPRQPQQYHEPNNFQQPRGRESFPQPRGRDSFPPPPPPQGSSRYNQQGSSPYERGRHPQRHVEPQFSGRGPAMMSYPPLSMTPPISPPMSPPHAAMFPGTSPVASPERGGYTSPSESPSRMYRLPRDDVPAPPARPALESRPSTMSIDPSRDGMGPRHPHVQQMTAQRSVDSITSLVPYPPQMTRQDRRMSAPVGPGMGPVPHPPRQRYEFSPTRQPGMQYDMRRPPPGAAAPYMWPPPPGAAAPHIRDDNRFPSPISPTPLRPSSTSITTLTPQDPDPNTGLVPYTLRQDRLPTGMETVRAPWT